MKPGGSYQLQWFPNAFDHLLFIFLRSYSLCKWDSPATTPRTQRSTCARAHKAPYNFRFGGSPLWLELVRQPNYHLLFLGTGLLGLQASAMKVPHLLPSNLQDRLSVHKPTPFCFSPLTVCTPALLCHPNYLHGEVEASHWSMPNIAR